MIDFSGKKALITGATGGIGGAVVRKLHSLGCKVVASGTNIEKLEALKAEFSENLEFVRCDLSDSESVKNLYQKAEDIFDGLDIIVCNAGITKDNLLLRMSEEDWDSVLNLNLKSVFLLNQLAAKYMSKRRSGRIINISSVVGLSGNFGQANYVAAKSGIIGLTKTVAQEVARRGITANCVAPGFIKTPMTDYLNEKAKDGIIGKIPLSRMGSVDEIASCVAFLASDEASYITGQVLSANGGLYM